jgi:hypothetical protein
MSARDTEDYVCGSVMLEQLQKEWGLRPIEKRNRLVVYDRVDVDLAIERKKIAEFKAE